MSNMTREEFLDGYFGSCSLNRDDTLTAHVVLLCNCEGIGCHGWAIVRDIYVEGHVSDWLEKESE